MSKIYTPMSNILTAEFPNNSLSAGAWLWSSSILSVKSSYNASKFCADFNFACFWWKSIREWSHARAQYFNEIYIGIWCNSTASRRSVRNTSAVLACPSQWTRRKLNWERGSRKYWKLERIFLQKYWKNTKIYFLSLIGKLKKTFIFVFVVFKRWRRDNNYSRARTGQENLL